MKKFLIVVFLSIVAIFFSFRYLWYSELKRITYENKTYEPFSDDLFLVQNWYANGHYFKLGLPYKKDIYGSPYTYTIIFSAKNGDIDNITFNEVIIIFPDEQVNILNENIEIAIKNGKIYTNNEIEKFRETKRIMITNESIGHSYWVHFKNIEIPFERINKIDTVLSITIHYKSGETFKRRIITNFEQKIEKMLTFPTV